MERGAKAGLELALDRVANEASRIAPFAYFRSANGPKHHLRDAAIVIAPKIDVSGTILGQVAFQVHSNAKSSPGFSYARARHEGFYYVTSDGKRNYEGRGRRVPTTGHFQYRHAADPKAEHQFLYHAARSQRYIAKKMIADSIAASLAVSL